MSHLSAITYTIKNLPRDVITGKKILEVGSYNVNGSVRDIIEYWKPSKYIGTDIVPGPGVDIVCKGEDLIKRFGKNSFDIIICNEVLEHSTEWRSLIHNMKNVCKIGGTIIITTRSKGFVYHPYPYDVWRYEIEDMRKIFSDCIIKSLESDSEAPGVFIKVEKPKKYLENNLNNYKLYSVVVNKRTINVFKKDFKNIFFLIKHVIFYVITRTFDIIMRMKRPYNMAKKNKK